MKHDIVRLSNSFQTLADVNAVTFACFSKMSKTFQRSGHIFEKIRLSELSLLFPQDDKQFLFILETDISQIRDGFYKMLLPFRD